MTTNRCFLGSLSILVSVFGHVWAFRGCLQFGSHDHILVSHVTRIQNRITLPNLHLSPWNPTPTAKVYWKAKSVAWICWNSPYCKSYDVMKFLWRHSFFNNMNFNKSLPEQYCWEERQLYTPSSLNGWLLFTLSSSISGWSILLMSFDESPVFKLSSWTSESIWVLSVFPRVEQILAGQVKKPLQSYLTDEFGSAKTFPPKRVKAAL